MPGVLSGWIVSTKTFRVILDPRLYFVKPASLLRREIYEHALSLEITIVFVFDVTDQADIHSIL